MTTLKGKWGFDSNLIIYALNKSSPFHLQIVNFFYKVKGSIEFYLADQNILESQYNLVRRYNLSANTAFEEINLLVRAFNFQLISPLPSTIYRYYEILSRVKAKKSSFFDTYLAATYIDNGIDRLLTNNEKDFKGIANFKVFNPLNN